MDGPNVEAIVTRLTAGNEPKSGEQLMRVFRTMLLMQKDRLSETEARAWIQRAIGAIRSARSPNPWSGSSDEEIAAEMGSGGALSKDGR